MAQEIVTKEQLARERRQFRERKRGVVAVWVVVAILMIVSTVEMVHVVRFMRHLGLSVGDVVELVQSVENPARQGYFSIHEVALLWRLVSLVFYTMMAALLVLVGLGSRKILRSEGLLWEHIDRVSGRGDSQA